MYIYICKHSYVSNYKSKVNIYCFSLTVVGISPVYLIYLFSLIIYPLLLYSVDTVPINYNTVTVVRRVGPVLTSYLLLCSHSANQLFLTVQSKESSNKLSLLWRVSTMPTSYLLTCRERTV
jgi:hypothetical protein